MIRVIRRGAFLLLFLLFCSPAVAETQECGGERSSCREDRSPSFAHMEWAAEAGWWMPWGNVERVVDPTLSAGLLLRTTYFDRIELFLAARYQNPGAVAHPKVGDAVPMALHQISGDVGLLFPLSNSRDPRLQFRLGGGFALFFIRAVEPLGNLLLDDNESDLGHWFRLESPALPLRKIKMRLFVEQQSAWTLKKQSHFWLSGITLESALW